MWDFESHAGAPQVFYSHSRQECGEVHMGDLHLGMGEEKKNSLCGKHDEDSSDKVQRPINLGVCYRDSKRARVRMTEGAHILSGDNYFKKAQQVFSMEDCRANQRLCSPTSCGAKTSTSQRRWRHDLLRS